MIYTKWIEGAGGLEDAHALRREVFINEQGTTEQEEMDDRDTDALHLVVYDGDHAVATGRMLFTDGKCCLGRICVRFERRGERLGDFLMRVMIRKAFDMGYNEQYIHAQTRVRGFYERLGFKAYGDEFIEADIPHIHMKRAGDISGSC